MTGQPTHEELIDVADQLRAENLELRSQLSKDLLFINEPKSCGLFRVNQVNLHWLRNYAMHRIWGRCAGGYVPGFNTTNKDGTLRATDTQLKPIARELIDDLEAAYTKMWTSSSNFPEVDAVEKAIARVKKCYEDY